MKILSLHESPHDDRKYWAERGAWAVLLLSCKCKRVFFQCKQIKLCRQTSLTSVLVHPLSILGSTNLERHIKQTLSANTTLRLLFQWNTKQFQKNPCRKVTWFAMNRFASWFLINLGDGTVFVHKNQKLSGAKSFIFIAWWNRIEIPSLAINDNKRIANWKRMKLENRMRGK